MKLEHVPWEWLNILGPASNQGNLHHFEAWNYFASMNIQFQQKEPLKIETTKGKITHKTS